MEPTERKPLFDIPLEKRREAFVRNRFGQDDVFGRSDIEAWLPLQRSAGRPDVEEWPRIISRGFLTMCAATAPLTHLRERATTRGEQHLPGSSLGVYGPIYDLLDHGLYWGHRDVGVFVAGDATFMVSGADEKLTIVSCDCASAVIDVLFAEWEWDRPKWEAARAFLCDALAEEIKRERAKAETDFDAAVAVSADGTKIVHADWVVVTGLGTITRGNPRYGQTAEERLCVFPGAAFRDRKILRTEQYNRIDPYSPNDSSRLRDDFPTLPVESQIARVLRRAEHPSLLDGVRSKGRQLFVRLIVLFGVENVEPVRWKIDLRTTVFITDVRSCPSPLPDGGVEVTV